MFKKYPKAPFALELGEWDNYYNRIKKEFPIRYILYEAIPTFFKRLKWRLSDGKYWVLHRFHPRHRYNMLKTGLSPGFYDLDDRFLYGCFNEFKHFYEINKVSGFYNQPYDTTQYCSKEFLEEAKKHDAVWETVRVESNDLYRWWTVDRLNRDEEMVSYNSKYDQEDTDNLVRLMKIRKFLWN